MSFIRLEALPTVLVGEALNVSYSSHVLTMTGRRFLATSAAASRLFGTKEVRGDLTVGAYVGQALKSSL